MAWFERVPSWAYQWCFFFVFTGVMAIVTGLIALLNMKQLGASVSILYLVASLVQAATAFTMFWMCRRSLAGTGEVAQDQWYASQFSH